jgi:hypothetical protein
MAATDLNYFKKKMKLEYPRLRGFLNNEPVMNNITETLV